MKQFLQQSLQQISVLVLPLLFIGTLATAAYTPPTYPPTTTPLAGGGTLAAGDTTVLPISTNSTKQEKLGGLAVYTFMTNAAAFFDQDVFFQSQLNAGTPQVGDVTSTLQIGNTTALGGANNVTDLMVTGRIASVLGLQSDTLKNSTKQQVCAKKDGTIVLCGNPGTSSATVTTGTASYCLNMAGSTGLPTNYVRDASGNCALKPLVATVQYRVKTRSKTGGGYVHYPSATITLDRPAVGNVSFRVGFFPFGIFIKNFACLPGASYNGGGCNWNTQVLAIADVVVPNGQKTATFDDINNDLGSLLTSVESGFQTIGGVTPYTGGLGCNTSLAALPASVKAATQCTIRRSNNNDINTNATTCPTDFHGADEFCSIMPEDFN